MRNSTVLYACNVSGMHSVQHAIQFGTVVYDWSNARALWTSAHPMSTEELLTQQAEMVYAADPGVPGHAPRVWVYRNTIKALNWFSSVRKKLDDPRFASWFVKFDGFSDSPYPGGEIARPKNGSYHVPVCDWYTKNGTKPRCSGFYHVSGHTDASPRTLGHILHCPLLTTRAMHVFGSQDQEQTPEHAGGGNTYPMDGQCFEQCDCGPINPCGEFIQRD